MKRVGVSAFSFAGTAAFFNAISGNPLPFDFQGKCILYSEQETAVFNTKLIGNERKWECIGTLKTVLPVWC